MVSTPLPSLLSTPSLPPSVLPEISTPYASSLLSLSLLVSRNRTAAVGGKDSNGSSNATIAKVTPLDVEVARRIIDGNTGGAEGKEGRDTADIARVVNSRCLPVAREAMRGRKRNWDFFLEEWTPFYYFFCFCCTCEGGT